MGLPVRLLLFVFLFASPASAAPTCQNMQGETVRCGTEGAMPVGWKLPAAQREQMASAISDESNVVRILQAICVLGVFFSLLALMPDFDGSNPGDWDPQEDRRNKRR